MDFQGRRRYPFTKEQDQRLVELVETKLCNGRPDWKSIAEIMGKTSKQCRERFNTYLAPDITHKAWTEEEDQRLRDLVEEHGKRWAMLRAFFPGKSDNMIKNRYNFHVDPAKFKKIKPKKSTNRKNTVPVQHQEEEEQSDDVSFEIFYIDEPIEQYQVF